VCGHGCARFRDEPAALAIAATLPTKFPTTAKPTTKTGRRYRIRRENLSIRDEKEQEADYDHAKENDCS